MKTKQSETFGSYIREARERIGLGLRSVAEQAGLSKSVVHMWETDVIHTPDMAKLQRLAIVLELDPIHLAELAGYDPKATLPPMQPYLRSKYPELPDAAMQEIAAITKKYGIDAASPGPRAGEDET